MPLPADDDSLDALRARIQATQDAVERLAAEAGRASEDPPTGDDGAGAEGQRVAGAGDDAAVELQALVRLVAMLRDLLPPDLQAQLTEVIRRVLVLVRAILDWWIDRMAPSTPAKPVEAEEIEIS